MKGNTKYFSLCVYGCRVKKKRIEEYIFHMFNLLKEENIPFLILVKRKLTILG